MTRRRLGMVVGFLALAGAGAWWFLRGRGADASPLLAPSVTLGWKGVFEGAATLPATVNWCPGPRLAIVEAVSNDTGFVMVIHAADTLTKGTIGLLPYDFVANAPKPLATAALRWPADSATLAGYRAQSGFVELVPSGGRLSGTFTVRMQPPMSMDTISVTGAFRNLAIESRAAGCP